MSGVSDDEPWSDVGDSSDYDLHSPMKKPANFKYKLIASPLRKNALSQNATTKDKIEGDIPSKSLETILEQSEIPNIKSASREVNQDSQTAQSSASKPTLKGASNSQLV